MGAWGIKALERDEGLDVLDILKNEYVPEHPVMDLGEMIELMKEEVMLGSDFSQIDFLFDNTAMALAELYFQWKDNSKLDYDHEEAIWDKVTGFTASKEALAFLLRQLTDIKNEVPDEDGIREIVDLWKNEDSGEIAPAWLEHFSQLQREKAKKPVQLDEQAASECRNVLSAFFAEMTEWEQYMEQVGFEDAEAVPRLLAIWEKYVSEKPRLGYRPLALSYSAQGTYNGEEFLDAEQITKNKLYIYTREKNTSFDRRFLMKRVGEGWMIDAVQERLDGWQRTGL